MLRYVECWLGNTGSTISGAVSLATVRLEYRNKIMVTCCFSQGRALLLFKPSPHLRPAHDNVLRRFGRSSCVMKTRVTPCNYLLYFLRRAIATTKCSSDTVEYYRQFYVLVFLLLLLYVVKEFHEFRGRVFHGAENPL